jgi:hypothetical protein
MAQMTTTEILAAEVIIDEMKAGKFIDSSAAYWEVTRT